LKSAQANSSRDPILKKNPPQKRAGGVAQIVKCPPSKHKSLSSNPNIAKRLKNEIKMESCKVWKCTPIIPAPERLN
jgi:hypothetical protein